MSPPGHPKGAEAVVQSLAAVRWLRGQGASQIYFKVCSTFDSTPQGNIGPVTEALMDEPGVCTALNSLDSDTLHRPRAVGWARTLQQRAARR